MPAGRSTVALLPASEEEGLKKYEGAAGVRPRWSARER